MIPTVLIYEDPVHEMILGRLFNHIGLDIGMCNLVLSGGKSRIDKNLSRYANASRTKRVIILRDLDNDAVCAPALKEKLLVGVDPLIFSGEKFVFRLTVREAEAWLLSDKELCKSYFKLRDADMDRLKPESLRSPKRKLFELIERGGLISSKKSLFYSKDSSGTLHQAPSYNDAIRPYVERWSVARAMAVSKSLTRAVRAIKRSYGI